MPAANPIGPLHETGMVGCVLPLDHITPALVSLVAPGHCEAPVASRPETLPRHRRLDGIAMTPLLIRCRLPTPSP
jgi:hypothetical protein